MNFSEITKQLNTWGAEHSQIDGVAFVRSYANGQYKVDSDVDICIFTSVQMHFIENTEWAKNFGDVVHLSQEKWGVVDTVRVFYRDGWELEFNFSSLSWACIPIDSGTLKVVSEGFKILYDPTNCLNTLKNHVSQS